MCLGSGHADEDETDAYVIVDVVNLRCGGWGLHMGDMLSPELAADGIHEPAGGSMHAGSELIGREAVTGEPIRFVERRRIHLQFSSTLGKEQCSAAGRPTLTCMPMNGSVLRRLTGL